MGERAGAKPKTGLVGWRGMVGSVLIERMRAEGDFAFIEPSFFSTTQAGAPAPDVGGGHGVLGDGLDVEALARCDILISCQGGDYTEKMHPQLRAAGWRGHWIDAASALRLNDESVIVLDPVNRHVIDAALAAGCRDWIGGNCTVSLMLMAFGGLFRAGLVEWMTTMTYQAASGAGAQQMRELLAQMGSLHASARGLLDDPKSAILDIDRRAKAAFDDAMPVAAIGYPLAGSLLPWVDRDLGNGYSREEWKAGAEGNKILGLATDPVPIDGLCVRVGAMRCHSQAVTIKLTRPATLTTLEKIMSDLHPWVRIIPNEVEATLACLTPAAVTGTLDIAVGRIRHLAMGEDYVTAFTVGDQLLWGAAEPLRRMLRILIGR
ncbi:MAG TPA: aspartate-semialdehyde dehydrogenase [Steroidobacteraceae bacterium]|nr:aspartate-semialdehyde dehydrogenase [Steroidobacteraceae bacterium]